MSPKRKLIHLSPLLSFYTRRMRITNTHASLKFVPSPFDVISIPVGFRLPRRTPAEIGYSRGGWVSAKSIDETGAAFSTNWRQCGDGKSPVLMLLGDECNLPSLMWTSVCVCFNIVNLSACLPASVCVCDFPVRLTGPLLSSSYQRTLPAYLYVCLSGLLSASLFVWTSVWLSCIVSVSLPHLPSPFLLPSLHLPLFQASRRE